MTRISADLILKNGRIATLDADETVVQAAACWNGRIVALGSDGDAEAFAGPGTRTIDLKGATVIPGLIDSHCHPDAHAITSTLWEDVKPEAVKSVDELLVYGNYPCFQPTSSLCLKIRQFFKALILLKTFMNHPLTR